MLELYSDHIAPHSDAIQDFDSQDHTDRTGQCISFKTPKTFSMHVNNTDKKPDTSQELRNILNIPVAPQQQPQADNKSISSNSSAQNRTNESQTYYSSSLSSTSKDTTILENRIVVRVKEELRQELSQIQANIANMTNSIQLLAQEISIGRDQEQ